jgi:membrane protein DedA with SNARE-associated domain
MGFGLWFDNRSREFKIGVSFLFIFISSVVGWLIGQVLFFAGWDLQQMLSLIALSCTIVLILVIFLIIKLKSE